jgi:membrane associated rhomboid family serine protease
MRFGGNSGLRGGYSGLRIGPGAISPFIKLMMIACAAMFLVQMLAPQITFTLGLVPATFFSSFPNGIFQIITYMFLHGGFFHLFFNMFALWMFGTEIEYTWGTRIFGKFYVLAGISGAILTLIINSSQLGPTIGASAAVYGVLVAYWRMFPEREVYLWFLLPVKVKWFIPIFMLIGFIPLITGHDNGIAHMAHLGGAVFGYVYLKMDWQWTSLGKRVKNLRYKRQEAKLQKRRQEAEDIMKRVDDILDKINEVGIENISKADRKFLEEASSELSRKKDPK